MGLACPENIVIEDLPLRVKSGETLSPPVLPALGFLWFNP